MPKSKVWIVKVGGSLAAADELPACLVALQRRSEPFLIVPGGGPFVTTTAAMQAHWKLADADAHVMAILGMAQYGWMLSALMPSWSRALGLAQIHPERGSAVWIPTVADIAEFAALPADWRVSGDSIALWVAHRLAAAGLILLKSSAPANAGDSAQEFADCGYVDRYFPTLLAEVTLPALWLAKDELLRDRLLLTAEEMAERRIR